MPSDRPDPFPWCEHGIQGCNECYYKTFAGDSVSDRPEAVHHGKPCANCGGCEWICASCLDDAAGARVGAEGRLREALERIAGSSAEITVQRKGEILPVHCQLCDQKIRVARGALSGGGEAP